MERNINFWIRIILNKKQLYILYNILIIYKYKYIELCTYNYVLIYYI